MPKLIMLVGLPGSGKSTFAKHLSGVRLSTDDTIEAVSKASGLTYNEVFKSVIQPATEKLDRDLSQAISEQKDIVWDQTNLTKKSRKRKLSEIPDNYEKICFYFFSTVWNVKKVNQDRKSFGRALPDDLLMNLIDGAQIPDESEGFDKVYTIIGE